MTDHSNSFPPPTPAPPGMPIAGKAALVAGVVAIVGSFMSWVTIVSVFGPIEMSGFKGDGKLTATAGALAVLAAYSALTTDKKSNATFASLAAIVGLAVGVYDLNNLSKIAGEATGEYVQTSVGNGLYLVIGGFVMFLFALWGAMPRRALSQAETAAVV